MRVNQQGIGNKHFKMYQVKEALLDPMTWAFFFYALIADIPNGGITNFFSQLVSGSRLSVVIFMTGNMRLTPPRSKASATTRNKV